MSASLTTPFRDNHLSVLCGICESPETVRCRRCKQPLCENHAPQRKQRCETCEAEYSSKLSRQPSPTRFLLIARALVPVCIQVSAVYLVSFLVADGLSFFTIFGAVWALLIMAFTLSMPFWPELPKLWRRRCHKQTSRANRRSFLKEEFSRLLP